MAQNDVSVSQTGGVSNTTFTEQIGDLNDLIIRQVVTGTVDGTNTAGVDAANPILQDGNRNLARVSQLILNESDHDPENTFILEQSGNDNKLAGATADAQFDGNGIATQISDLRMNFMNVLQDGHRNKIGLYQKSQLNNVLGNSGTSMTQQGNENELVVYQTSTGGSNYARSQSNQIGSYNTAKVKQTGVDNQELELHQNGNSNLVGGAYLSGGNAVADESQPSYALQVSTGLNDAEIDQSGNLNTVGFYQSTTNGFNTMYVSQDGGDTGAVYQSGAGNNVASIIQ